MTDYRLIGYNCLYGDMRKFYLVTDRVNDTFIGFIVYLFFPEVLGRGMLYSILVLPVTLLVICNTSGKFMRQMYHILAL